MPPAQEPQAWRFWLRGVQIRIAAAHELIEPVRLGLRPFDPPLLLGRELVVLACSILDSGAELAQAVCALQLARVAKQGAQVTTLLVSRTRLRFVFGAGSLVVPPAALIFLFLRAHRFG